jgi:hypothetical protein
MVHIRKMPSCESFSRIWGNVLVLLWAGPQEELLFLYTSGAVSVLYPVEIANEYICHHVSET